MGTNLQGEVSASQTIRVRRLALQISQERLAQLAGCSHRWVQKIEAGHEPGFSSAGGKSRTVSRIEAVLDKLEEA